jgi:hypothetical protein
MISRSGVQYGSTRSHPSLSGKEVASYETTCPGARAADQPMKNAKTRLFMTILRFQQDRTGRAVTGDYPDKLTKSLKKINTQQKEK